MAAYRHWPGMEQGHTFKDADLAGKPAAGYFRVSSNPDETEQKSVDDQEAEYLGWTGRTGVRSGPADRFKDDDRSASIFATRQRENFSQLREAIEAGRYKVVWFWATSRQTRGDVNIYELAKVSADHGVLWCVGGQLLNPANEDDLLFLGIHHLMDRQYAWRISKDVRRGQKSVAHAGKPGGRVAYGYRRIHRIVKGKKEWVRDEPNVFDGNGRPIADSPAYVVREIYDRIEAGEPIGAIARTLEDRRVPTPQPPGKCRTCGARTEAGECPQGHEIDKCMWTAKAVKFIARNPVYIRGRIYQSESWRPADRLAAVLPLVTGQWPELIGEEQWWAVQRILSAPDRGTFSPRTGQTLLAGVARCGECGWPLHLHNDHARGVVPYYVCSHRSHVGIRTDWLDAYVEDRVVSWLADPQVHAYLWGRREDDSATATAARADVERLEHLIEECRTRGEDPDADAVFWERRSVALAAKLAEARKLAQPASLAPMLAEMIGPDAADRWWALRRDNLPAAKQLIRAVADIRVHKGIHGGDRHNARIDPGRISWAWLTGPGDRQRVFGETAPRPRDRAAEALRAGPEEADHALAQKAGTTHRTVQLARRELEDAGEIPVLRRKGRGAPVNHGYQPRSVA